MEVVLFLATLIYDDAFFNQGRQCLPVAGHGRALGGGHHHNSPGQWQLVCSMATSSSSLLLGKEQREELVKPLVESRGWNLGDFYDSKRDALTKEFTFKDFIAAYGFMTQIAIKSESINHHPEWFNVYNRVRLTWSTHDCSGISQLDIQMAQFCDLLYTATLC